MKVDWSNFISPRERAQLEKERNAPSPYQAYSYSQWKELDPPEIKVLKHQSDFERDYHGAFAFDHWSVTKPWKLEEELKDE